jgi:DNA repair protein RadA/Sms
MATIKTIFVCSNCDAQHPKWSGRCLECGSWGTLHEEVSDNKDAQKEMVKKLGSAEIIDLSAIKATSLERLKTGISEIDRVLGGGLVPGSLVLLSGEPGIGKSTLVAQIANAVGKNYETIYVSGEESATQVKARLTRLECDLKNLKFISETILKKLLAPPLKLNQIF